LQKVKEFTTILLTHEILEGKTPAEKCGIKIEG